MDLNLVYGTWGNVSMKLSEDRILITPSGIPYDTLREEDLVLCDKNGSVLEGTLPPSSELKMHVAIYATRKHVNAIIHTHSLYASVASTIFNEVPLLTEDVAMVIGGKLKVTSYRLPGTQELADEIVRNIGDTNAVIIANHGQVSVGVTAEDAILAALMCEKASQMYVIATGTGKVPSSLSDQDIKNFYDKYVNSYKKLKEAKK